MGLLAPHPWYGYFPAVTTPFDSRLRVDYAAFAELVDWLIGEGMHGIAAAGSTGEWHALTRPERCRLFHVTRSRTPASRRTIAGCSALRLEDTQYYLDAAHDTGFDAALLTVPPYVCPTDAEAVAYFRGVADTSPIPLIVYNWPQGTGTDLSLESLRALASHEGILGIKNSTPDRDAFRASLVVLANMTLIFGVMPGTEGIELLRTTRAAGCIGAAGVLGRAQPGFYDAVATGDRALAVRYGRGDERLMATFFSGFRGRFAHAVPTLKFLLGLRGLPSGRVRPPLLDVDAAQAARITRLVEETALFSNA
jgi:dihydrodipicolinate synthase/N-acetylneuraminate lyase